jgi:hypothetical protein
MWAYIVPWRFRPTSSNRMLILHSSKAAIYGSGVPACAAARRVLHGWTCERLSGLLKDQKTEGVLTGIWGVGRYIYMYEVYDRCTGMHVIDVRSDSLHPQECLDTQLCAYIICARGSMEAKPMRARWPWVQRSIGTQCGPFHPSPQTMQKKA